MARRLRINAPGFPFHVVQRGNNRQVIFRDDLDRLYYLECLVRAADRYDCAVHCYALMGNHVHLLVTPGRRTALAKMMQSVGVRYVQYVNKRYERTGGLWDGRYRDNLVNTDAYLVVCYRYIELNPVRAGLVAFPADWHWSSHRCNAYGEPDRIVTMHSYYAALAPTGKQRRSRYREWFKQSLTDGELRAVRKAIRQQLALDDEVGKSELVNGVPGSGGRRRKAKK